MKRIFHGFVAGLAAMCLALASLSWAGAQESLPGAATTPVAQAANGQTARPLSAFFGLDNRLPGINRICQGGEPGDAERALYRVTVERPDGSRDEIAPAALADLGDRDNNHLLCLDTSAPAVSVSFPAGHLVDPNRDLNPDTRVAVERASPAAPPHETVR